ncbi:MAG: hypothetical protein JO180_09010 [Gemmatirosa sp.]|nr:hypothetical protein [Gemmatirosa sp.]
MTTSHAGSRTGRRGQRRTATRTIVGAVAVGAAAALVASLVTLPDTVTERVVLATAAWVLPGSPDTTADGSAGRKLVGTFAQYAAAATFRRHHPLPAGVDDADRVFRRLVALRATLASQVEVAYAPPGGPALLTGLGWCDELNGAAAVTLAGELGRADLVGLHDPQTAAEHTVGRVWSRSRRRWLYFDLWGDRIAVFTASPAGARILASADAHPARRLDPAARASVERMWNRAAAGVPFTSFAPTFGGQLWLRARMAARRGSLVGPRSTTAIAAATAAAAMAATAPSAGPVLPVTTAQRFLRARLDQLEGDVPGARQAYRAVADAGGPHAASPLALTAQLFLARLAR